MSKRRAMGGQSKSDPLTEEFEEYLASDADTGPDDMLVRHGLAVEQIEPSTESVGRERWVIVRIRQGQRTYAGKTLAWSPSKFANISFDTEQEATRSAYKHAASIEQFSTEPEYAVTQASLRIPMVIDANVRSYPLRLSVVLDLQESQVVESVRKALRQLNAEVRPGKPVFSNADAVRWLLSQIPYDAPDRGSSA